MTVTHEIDQEYAPYRVRVRGGPDAINLMDVAGAEILDSDGERVCWFTESVEWAFRPKGWPSDQMEVTKRLVERAFHRARGAILVDRVADLDGQRLGVPREESYATRSEDYLRGVVLKVFKRVYRLDPLQGGRMVFDDIGVALAENVDPQEVNYILTRLAGDGLIKSFAMGSEYGSWLYMPTPEGLRMADKLADESRAPSALVEETVAEVERALNLHSPELVERLRSLSLRIAETAELSHVDVGVVAQDCDLILQEFLDLPALWQGIGEDQPPKDMTKKRLSILLRAKVPSETERALVDALDTYVRGWFDSLDTFITKHRHTKGPEQSDRRHAKRIVTYTYLLLADLIALLGI